MTESGVKRPDVVAVALAGGRAMRMGGADKGLRLLGGRPALAHVLGAVAPQVAAVAINANGDFARFAAFGVPVLADIAAGQPGPLAGVEAGLAWARAAHPAAHWLLTVPTDAPFLPPDLVARLHAAATAKGAAIAVATSGDWTHPTAALWRVDLGPAVSDALAAGTRKVMDVQAAHGAVAVEWPVQPHDPFFNVNTPADLAVAEAMLAAAPIPTPSPLRGEGRGGGDRAGMHDGVHPHPTSPLKGEG
jgi:molybdopterin-guanine dinucleotide biosynthesis protein A